MKDPDFYKLLGPKLRASGHHLHQDRQHQIRRTLTSYRFPQRRAVTRCCPWTFVPRAGGIAGFKRALPHFAAYTTSAGDETSYC